jgi:surface protein
MSLIIHTTGEHTRLSSANAATFLVHDKEGTPVEPTLNHKISLPAQLSPFTLTGVVTDPRFEGSIQELNGDFGAVFQGSYEGMFQGCQLGNLMPGDETIVLNTTSAASMFAGASSSDWSFVRKFDVSQVTNFSSMFREVASFNQPLDHWDVTRATDLSFMFASAWTFDQPLDHWDVSRANNLSFMFRGAEAFDQPLNSWNVSSASDLSYMFYCAKAFNQPLDSWNVSRATKLSYMFYCAEAFNQPLNSWNVSSATNLAGMFSRAEAFNQPLNSWNVSSATNLSCMFAGATAFTQAHPNFSRQYFNTTKTKTVLRLLEGVEVPVEQDCLVCLERLHSITIPLVLLHPARQEQAKHVLCRRCFDQLEAFKQKSFLTCPACRENVDPKTQSFELPPLTSA